MIARIKKFENADSTEFFRAEPSASKGKCGIGCNSNKPPYPEKDYLREEGRAPAPNGSCLRKTQFEGETKKPVSKTRAIEKLKSGS